MSGLRIRPVGSEPSSPPQRGSDDRDVLDLPPDADPWRAVRRKHNALSELTNLHFHFVDNDNVLLLRPIRELTETIDLDDVLRLDPEALVDYIAGRRIDVVDSTPSHVQQLVLAGLKAGAKGYLLKDVSLIVDAFDNTAARSAVSAASGCPSTSLRKRSPSHTSWAACHSRAWPGCGWRRGGCSPTAASSI